MDRLAWRALVRESETGTWFQSPEAYDFLSSMPDLFSPFAIGVERVDALTKARNLRGVCVGYVTQEKNRLKQFFTLRAIILGGPALANDASEEEVALLLQRINELAIDAFGKPIYIETRNFNDYSRWRRAFEQAGFRYKAHLNFHVIPGANKLSDNRKRQLKKSDAISELATNESDIRAWYTILQDLYRTKVKTPLWPVDFFLEAYRQGVGTFLLVKKGHEVIGGSMVVSDGQCVYEWFECGLNAQYKEQYPSVIATCAGIRYAQTQGCARYDMMGAGAPDVPYGVRDFKAEFGGNMVEHGRFLCVCQPLLYRIGALGVKWLKRH